MKIDAVRAYPGGGLIYEKVRPCEVMSVRAALKQLSAGRPACVMLDHLYVLRCMLEPEQEVQP